MRRGLDGAPCHGYDGFIGFIEKTKEPTRRASSTAYMHMHMLCMCMCMHMCMCMCMYHNLPDCGRCSELFVSSPGNFR